MDKDGQTENNRSVVEEKWQISPKMLVVSSLGNSHEEQAERPQ